MCKSKVLPDVKHYWMTEKFDGYRTLCVEKKLYTRNHNQIMCPKWFSDLLPDDINLDGELFTGYGNWNICGSFRRKIPDESVWRCETTIYIVFDVIDSSDTPYYVRYNRLLEYVNKAKNMATNLMENGEQIRKTPPIRIVSYNIVRSLDNLNTMFNHIVEKGGEGVIFRNPIAKYFTTQKSDIYRIKKVYMKEGVIIGYKISSSQKYNGLLSSFVVIPIADEDDDGRNIKKGQLLKNLEFSVSSGLTEHIRKTYTTTFPIGTIVQYKCNDYTSTGKPRHPAFLRKREGHVNEDGFYELE